MLEKIGMEYEATLKRHIKKSGEFKNIEYYGIFRSAQPRKNKM